MLKRVEKIDKDTQLIRTHLFCQKLRWNECIFLCLYNINDWCIIMFLSQSWHTTPNKSLTNNWTNLLHDDDWFQLLCLLCQNHSYLCNRTGAPIVITGTLIDRSCPGENQHGMKTEHKANVRVWQLYNLILDCSEGNSVITQQRAGRRGREMKVICPCGGDTLWD